MVSSERGIPFDFDTDESSDLLFFCIIIVQNIVSPLLFIYLRNSWRHYLQGIRDFVEFSTDMSSCLSFLVGRTPASRLASSFLVTGWIEAAK